MKIETLIVGPLETNCYVVSGDRAADGVRSAERTAAAEAIIIDPGGSPEKIKNYIERSGVKPILIVLTHGHSDHMAAAAGLAANYGIDVAMHNDDLDTLDMSVADAPMWGLANLENVPITRKLSEGDTIEFGGESGKVIHTPGHTKGGICLLFKGVVFVGDTLFALSIGRTDFFGGDLKAILDSIRRKLFTLPEDTAVYTGHGPATTIGTEKRRNPFFVGSF